MKDEDYIALALRHYKEAGGKLPIVLDKCIVSNGDALLRDDCGRTMAHYKVRNGKLVNTTMLMM